MKTVAPAQLSQKTFNKSSTSFLRVRSHAGHRKEEAENHSLLLDNYSKCSSYQGKNSPWTFCEEAENHIISSGYSKVPAKPLQPPRSQLLQVEHDNPTRLNCNRRADSTWDHSMRCYDFKVLKAFRTDESTICRQGRTGHIKANQTRYKIP